MSTATTRDGGVPVPAKGTRAILDGLPGGACQVVIDGVAGDTVAISPAWADGLPPSLAPGHPFTICWSPGEVPCEVDAELIAHPTAGVLSARLTGPPRRNQRRDAVRVPVHLIVRARAEDGEDERPLAAITENLSAGGALLRMPEALEPGRALRLSVDCGGAAGTVDLGARVVRCDREPAGERPWRVAIAFVDITTADEDRLVRLIFERQRELRRRATGLA